MLEKIDIFVKNSNNPYSLNVIKFLPPNKRKVHLFVVSSVEFNLRTKTYIEKQEKSVIKFYFNHVISKLQDIYEKHEASKN